MARWCDDKNVRATHGAISLMGVVHLIASWQNENVVCRQLRVQSSTEGLSKVGAVLLLSRPASAANLSGGKRNENNFIKRRVNADAGDVIFHVVR